MRKVALVGFSSLTLPYVKDSKADEFWTLNHAVFCQSVLPRIDRLFELHHRDWYMRAEMEKANIYDEWLRKAHPFPIYMQENELTDLVPSGVRYPFEEIVGTLLPHLRRAEGGEFTETITKYFTSSIAFMIALAIYEGFDSIEIYGVDMDNNTEYGYQKSCAEFWIGLALGRGIQVVIPEPCLLLNAPLYGYDVVPYIDQANVRQILNIYQEERKRRKEAMDVAAAKVTSEPDNQEVIEEYLVASSWVYIHDGAINAAGRLLEESDSYISRQFIDLKQKEWLNGVEYWKSMVNTVKGKMELHDRKDMPQEYWVEYLNSRASMYANLGAAQLHTRLMHIIDFRPANLALSMDIKEE